MCELRDILFQIIGKDLLPMVQTSTSKKRVFGKITPNCNFLADSVKYLTENEKVLFNINWAILCQNARVIQADQLVSVHLMFTVQKTRKIILNCFNHLP
jgi:hypothetical protein